LQPQFAGAITKGSRRGYNRVCIQCIIDCFLSQTTRAPPVMFVCCVNR